MAGPDTVFSKHEAALRKLARDAQDIVRISETACSTYLKKEQQLHEELSGLEKKVAEGNVQIKQLKAELAQVRGELTEDRKTLQDNKVTIAKLEATVRAQELTIQHENLLERYNDLYEKFLVHARDLSKTEEENKKMRTELEQRRSSDGKRTLTEADTDTAETDPKKERRG